MKTKSLSLIVAAACCMTMTMNVACSQKAETATTELTTVGNPYMPLWEHIPDGEPYVFEDPDQPGKLRVYLWFARQSGDGILRSRPGSMVCIC